MTRSSLLLSAAALALASVPAAAAELSLQVDVPKIPVAEYHRPYVAVWVQRPDGAQALSVWWDTAHEEKGRRYLKELTGWWRRQGRETGIPADAVSGATRAPGPQRLALDTAHGPLAHLPPGAYQRVVEAAREQGGHEQVRLPLTLPLAPGAAASAHGAAELGAVAYQVR